MLFQEIMRLETFEYSTPENCFKGANVLLNTLLRMDKELD